MDQQSLNIGYGTTKSTPKASDNEISAIPPGIHEDVVFKGAFFEKLKDDSESEVLHFVFEKNNQQIRDVLFPIDIDRIRDNYEKYPPEAVKRSNPELGLNKGDVPTVEQKIGMAFQLFNTRLNEYMDNLISDDEQKLTGILDSYEAIGNAVIARLEPYKGKMCRIKVVLNNKDYSAFPAYGSFLESMEVTTALSGLKIKPSDKMQASNVMGSGGSLPPGSGPVAPDSPSGATLPPPPPPPPPGAGA